MKETAHEQKTKPRHQPKNNHKTPTIAGKTMFSERNKGIGQGGVLEHKNEYLSKRKG